VKGSTAELEAAWVVGRKLWQSSDIPGAFASLNYAWRPAIEPYAAKLVEELRARQFLLLSRAYTVIGVPAAAAALGLDEAQALQACEAKGWHHRPDTGMLAVVPAAIETKPFKGLEEIQDLAKHVAFLERRSVTKDHSKA